MLLAEFIGTFWLVFSVGGYASKAMGPLLRPASA